MKLHSRGISAITLLLFTAGLWAKVIDISGVQTEAELDKYVDTYVAFTGEVATTKTPSTTNGHVYIESRAKPDAGEKTVTISGKLRKREVKEGSSTDAQGRPIQAPYPGAHYYLEGRDP